MWPKVTQSVYFCLNIIHFISMFPYELQCKHDESETPKPELWTNNRSRWWIVGNPDSRQLPGLWTFSVLETLMTVLTYLIQCSQRRLICSAALSLVVFTFYSRARWVQSAVFANQSRNKLFVLPSHNHLPSILSPQHINPPKKTLLNTYIHSRFHTGFPPSLALTPQQTFPGFSFFSGLQLRIKPWAC